MFHRICLPPTEIQLCESNHLHKFEFIILIRPLYAFQSTIHIVTFILDFFDENETEII